MSLSEISPIQITFSTAQEISDEILGGAIQFCRESGLIQNITTLTLLWSAFLLSSQEELVENNIIENVKHCYTRSLDNIFPNITTDTETKAQIESMLKNYWENLCVDFTNLRTNVEITNFLYIADKISNDGNADIAYQITEVQQNSFARVASVIRSSIYRILRKIDNGMAIRYSHILDEMRFARICQENTTTQQALENHVLLEAFSGRRRIQRSWSTITFPDECA